MAPAVFFAHGYHGTCISGGKTFKFPVVKPCTMRFGWQCLMHFYPHRCGGLNPITMWADFRRASRRLKMLRSYRAIITASVYVRSEYLRHGFAAEVVRYVPLPVDGAHLGAGCLNGTANPDREHKQIGAERLENLAGRVSSEVPPYRLLFAGRMELLKGGALLLEALPLMVALIGRPLRLTFVGEGPERHKWEEKAIHVRSREPRLEVIFTGWLEGAQLERVVDDSDLLIVPSLWPEPFGLVGPEAGLHSLPAAGFAVGGIPEWLFDGINGYLAPGDPPTPAGLALAVVKCLREPGLHAQLRRGALTLAQRFSMSTHMNQIMRLFESVAGYSSNPLVENRSL